MIPLFKKYPKLEEKLPYISLCDLPTPVIHLSRLGAQLGVKSLYLKQDGLTSKHYGGNKIRKLEFLLGEAKQKGEGMGGGAGGGAWVRPRGVIIVDKEGVRVEPIMGGMSFAVERIGEVIPRMVERFIEKREERQKEG